VRCLQRDRYIEQRVDAAAYAGAAVPAIKTTTKAQQFKSLSAAKSKLGQVRYQSEKRGVKQLQRTLAAGEYRAK
jgi:hypothetical protein